MCKAKDDGVIDFKWPELAQLLNAELFDNEDDWLNDCVYRKEYRAAKEFYDDVFSLECDSNAVLNKIRDERRELEKLKIQIADQRRELRKYDRIEARTEHLHEIIRNAAKELPRINIQSRTRAYEDDIAEAVLFLNDWHYGMVTSNIWNAYDTQICGDRITELADKVCCYLQRHGVHTLHIALLGDMCAGAIHTGTRVESEEVVCEQLMNVSELLAWFIAEVAQYVETVNIYSTYGNHMRTIQNKHDSIHRDNMERIIPWWLKERFAQYTKIHIIERDDQYAELIHINVCGSNVIASHGDLEVLRKAGPTLHTLFSKTMGIDVDYIVVGDKHHAENIESLGVDCTIVPAMCGTDEYAHNKRLYSSPGQTMMIFTPGEGKECVYRIGFKRP